MELQGLNQITGDPFGQLALGKAERALEGVKDGRNEETVQEFQKLLSTMLVKEMRRALPEGLFGEGQGADVYEGWFDEHLGASLAERDALGFAAIVRADLIRKESVEQQAKLAEMKSTGATVTESDAS